MCGEMIPRILHKEMREKRRIMARSCHRTAVLSLNVVDFTYLCADASPEQITIILSKLLDMIEHRLENYQNLFKVYKGFTMFRVLTRTFLFSSIWRWIDSNSIIAFIA